MAFEDRTPRDEGKFSAFLNKGALAVGEFDGLSESAFDGFAHASLKIFEPKLLGKLRTHPCAEACLQGRRRYAIGPVSVPRPSQGVRGACAARSMSSETS